MNIDDQISALKSKVQSATAAKYRAEAAKESAQVRYNEAMAALADRFGLDNLSDARAKLTELQESLEKKVSEANQILDTMKF